jgi:hypothetical protein
VILPGKRISQELELIRSERVADQKRRNLERGKSNQQDSDLQGILIKIDQIAPVLAQKLLLCYLCIKKL